MRVLFLDIDGVLNNESTKERIGGDGLFSSMIGLDSRLVAMFLAWRADREIDVVISSTWRLHGELLELIAQAGVSYIGITRNLGHRSREIDDWLAAHPDIEAYAILDDIAQFAGHQQRFFVQTSFIHGLRAKNLQKVERILGRPPQEKANVRIHPSQ